jgi:glycosyltransferase involved in cell wall biosynthesis
VKTVLIFTPRYPPSTGGAATFYSNLVEVLSDEYQFLVVSCYLSGEPVVSQVGDAQVYRVVPRFETVPRLIRVPLESIVVFFLTVFLRLFSDIEVIHTHASSFAVIGLALAAKLTRTPILYDCRDEAFRPWIVRRGPTRLWLSCSSGIDDILINRGIPSDRILRVPVVNPEYVTEYRRKPEFDTDSSPELLYVGEIREEKGIFVLLEAFEQFHRDYPDTRLKLVGDGPAEDDVQYWISREGLDDVVTATGQVAHREALERIAQADVLILPSASEGLPRVIVEAMEIGTPVVSTPVGSVPDIVNHEETGMLIERSPESLCDTLDRLFEDPMLCEQLAKRAQHKQKNREWQAVSETVRTAYESLTRGTI